VARVGGVHPPLIHSFPNLERGYGYEFDYDRPKRGVKKSHHEYKADTITDYHYEK
jgi:hypothetical protein